MKPIFPASATQSKPHLPPKPIQYRIPQPPAASHADEELRNPVGPKHPPRDQFQEEPLSFPRSQIEQGHHRSRYQNDQALRPQPPPRTFTDQGQHHRRALSSPPPKALIVVERERDPGGCRSLLSSSTDPPHFLRHSESRAERMKLERERFLANLVPSEGGTARLSSQTASSVGQCASMESSRNPPPRSLPPSPISNTPSSVCPKSGCTSERLNDNSSASMMEKSSVTSQSKPNQTSLCAANSAIVTPSTTEVTSSHSKPSVTLPAVSSVKPTTVTSSEVTGSDVIYDEPSVDIERKSLDRLILVDGYLKLRSDVVVEMDSVRGSSRLNARTSDPSKSGVRPAHSSESVDRLEALLDFSDYGGALGKPLGRSSFVDPNGPPCSRRSVYIELGEYQTLLKHSRSDNDECLYSLPQPLCYSEDTLKAVKLITEKYDTFKRRQLRDLSFRDGAVTHRKCTEDGVVPLPARTLLPLQSSSIAESNNNKSNGNGSVQEVGASGDPETATDPDGLRSVREKVCEGVEVKSKKQSGSLLLRDYCNTLETGVDGASGSSSGLSKLNLMRIELFYRSQEASVYVCRCLADLFVGASVGEDSSCPIVHQHTGVPVWLLNSGEGVRSRELLLVVAERETGLPLWQDKINYLSNYEEVSPGVHSLRVSGSLRKTVRLHMFCERSAAEFMARFHEIASDPNDDLWKISSKDPKDASKRKSGQARKTKKKTTTKKRRPRLSKSSISQPCNFVHISRVDPLDANFRAAFSGLIPLRPGKTTIDPSTDPSRDLDIAGAPLGDSCKAFVSVAPAAENENFESAAADSSVCEFRPRLPTR